MKNIFAARIKRLVSGVAAAAITVSAIPVMPAMAAATEKYPYTLFAASNEEGSITVNSGNFCVNGNVATNGTISSSGNMNINGIKTENAGLDMIYIFDKIDSKYFYGKNVEEHSEDYVLDEMNININDPVEVYGDAALTGNININTALKAFEDITLNGEVKNTNDSVIFSKYGDIVIDSTNVNLNGLVYAPFGSVEVKAMNLNLNNVVIIADSITFDCPSVNANYSSNAADFVGTVSEPLKIPKDEWQYMKDENGTGLPDIFKNYGNWSKLADTDGDGLPDGIEEYVGSDPNNIDTDDDGLNDYYEVFVTFTDSTKADSDENGVNDGDEDFDDDGLTNLEEFLTNTYPYSNDSDNDGLSDGDEVKKYGTDPLVADTDGDGLEDGDEIILGTDPLVQDTDGDGVIDSKEKFQQLFTHKVKNEDCAVTEVVVDMECTGNINHTTTVESVMNVDILCTDVVGLVGEPFEIETTSEFDTAILTFSIDKSKLGETEFDNLIFLWYNEKEDEFVELETVLDEENSTASIVTTHFSKYMLVDREGWFGAWKNAPDYIGLSKYIPYDTVICVDCSGSMSSNDPYFNYTDSYGSSSRRVNHRILAIEQYVNSMMSGDRTAIINYANGAYIECELTCDRNVLNSAINPYNSGGTNAQSAVIAALDMLEKASIQNRTIILLSDGDVNVDNSIIARAKSSFVRIYCVGLGGEANSTKLKRIAEETHGNHYIAATADELAAIYNDISIDQFFSTDWEDNDEDGIPDDFEASGLICSNGKIYYTRYMNKEIGYDSDGDGLSDGQEIRIGLKRKYIGVGPSEYVIYFQMVSNPLSADSDYDGIADGWVDVYGTQQTNDSFPMIKASYNVPSYVKIAIEFSGLSKRDKKFEEDNNLDTLYACADPKLQENGCLYTTSLKEDSSIFGIGRYYCSFYISYYEKNKADEILAKLTNSKQTAENIISFLDDISNPLSDPNMVGPLWVGDLATIYSWLRTIGVINPAEQAEDKLNLFLALYCRENGKTPLCVIAAINQILKDGEASEYKKYQNWL